MAQDAGRGKSRQCNTRVNTGKPSLHEVLDVLSQDHELLSEFIIRLGHRIRSGAMVNTENALVNMMTTMQMCRMQVAQGAPGLTPQSVPSYLGSMKAQAAAAAGAISMADVGHAPRKSSSANESLIDAASAAGARPSQRSAELPDETTNGVAVMVKHLPKEWRTGNVKQALEDTGFLCGQDFSGRIEHREGRARVVFAKRMCAKAFCRLLPVGHTAKHSRGPWPDNAVAVLAK